MNKYKNFAAILGCIIASLSFSPAHAQLGGLLDDVVDTVDDVLGGGSGTGDIVDDSGSGLVNVELGGETVSVLPGNDSSLNNTGLSGAGAVVGGVGGVTLGGSPADQLLGVGNNSVLLGGTGGGILPPGGNTTNNITNNNFNTRTSTVNSGGSGGSTTFNNNSRLSQLEMLLRAGMWQKINSCALRVNVVDVQRWLPRNERQGLYQVLGRNAQNISLTQSALGSRAGCILAQAGLSPSDVIAVDYRGGNQVTLLAL